MKHNFFVALAIVGVVGFGGVAAAPTSALTVGDIQAQIRELLAKVAELTKQLNVLQSQSTSTTPGEIVSAVSRHRICSVLYRNLSQGVKGDDVTSLQEFLRDEGYLSANATGYFGPMTAQALARWQTSQGVESVGAVGPLTRGRIKVWCGGGNTERFSAEPQRGSAPLIVTFKTNIQLANPQFVADAGDYKIVFGDGTEQALPCSGNTPWCEGPHRITHTYAADGTYTAQLVHYGYFGPPGPSGIPSTVVGSVTITVGQIACTKEYKPVCGSKPIVCITTPCNPIQQTYSNRCMMEADGASFLYEGECRSTNTDPASDLRCKSWYDGCNTCSREYPGGPAACTLRACAWQTPAYCISYYTDQNKPPPIASFSGPTTLTVRQTGTWTIQASDPENGSLSYRVAWGDELKAVPAASAPAREAFVQTTTFTHTYSAAGTYTIIVVVRDASGQEAKTSTTVRVGGAQVFCTMEYTPVCGQPPEPACRYSIPACMIPTPGPQTYGNRCELDTAEATFLYEGECRNEPFACTADAMQCPDGSWVSRTGPNCQFVCPSGVISAVCPSRAEDARKKLTCPYGPFEYYTDGDGCSIPKCGTPQPGVIY